MVDQWNGGSWLSALDHAQLRLNLKYFLAVVRHFGREPNTAMQCSSYGLAWDRVQFVIMCSCRGADSFGIRRRREGWPILFLLAAICLLSFLKIIHTCI